MNFKEYPEITEKQKEIVSLVFKFRFINRKQIQKILGHKDSHRINAWLKDLVEKKFLGRIYSHKLFENTKPAIYYLQNNGVLWAKYNELGEGEHFDDCASKGIKKYYADKTASQIFIDHSVAMCNLYLQFKEQEGDKWDYQCQTKSDLSTQFLRDGDYNERRPYFPDMFIEKLTKDLDHSTTVFVDLFPPHIPKYALEYKVRQYIEMCDAKEWKHFIGGIDNRVPDFLFILPSQGKLNRLAKYIQETLDESYDVEDVRFMLTTYKKAMEQGVADNKIWKVLKDESM